MHTDGGGFALVGIKDSPVSWTVPSNAIPVHPQGPPHWSSNLGDLKPSGHTTSFRRRNLVENRLTTSTT